MRGLYRPISLVAVLLVGGCTSTEPEPHEGGADATVDQSTDRSTPQDDAEGGSADGGTKQDGSDAGGSTDHEGSDRVGDDVISDAMQDAEASVPTGLAGFAAKGPFGLGASVSIAEVDANANPTGRVFNVQTIDNVGRFSVANVPAGYYSISTSGFYFNELAGQLSASSITLRAFHLIRAGGPATASVNIITHLAYNRASALVKTGMSLLNAETQAEAELQSSLHLALSPSGSLADQWSFLSGDSDANAYLFAVSVIFLETAQERAAANSSPLEATLDQLINQTAADLADDGQLSASVVTELRGVQPNIYPEVLADTLGDYLATNGTNVTLPDLNRVLDTDVDGIANNADNCPFVPNPSQNTITGKICRVHRHVTPFAPRSTTIELVQGLAVGDFNEDGHMDAVPIGQGGINRVMLGDGKGRFDVRDSAPKEPSSAARWFAMDVNGDQHLDLVQFQAAGSQQNALPAGYYPGDGNGAFGALVSFAAVIGQFPSILDGTFGDLDGDGVVDLVTTGMTTGEPPIFRKGMGQGNFAAGTPLLNCNVDGGADAGATDAGDGGTGCGLATYYRADAFDVTGDGNLDVVLTGDSDSHGSGATLTLVGDGHGSFRQVGPILGTRVNSPVIADFDGDGHVDLIGQPNAGGLGVSFGDNTGLFGVSTIIFPTASGANRPFSTGHFLGTTKTDMVGYVQSGSNGWDLQLQPGGTAPFLPAQVIPQPDRTGNFISHLMTADVDGDGHPDVLYAGVDDVSKRFILWTLLMN